MVFQFQRKCPHFFITKLIVTAKVLWPDVDMLIKVAVFCLQYLSQTQQAIGMSDTTFDGKLWQPQPRCQNFEYELQVCLNTWPLQSLPSLTLLIPFCPLEMMTEAAADCPPARPEPINPFPSVPLLPPLTHPLHSQFCLRRGFWRHRIFLFPSLWLSQFGFHENFSDFVFSPYFLT